MGIYLIICLVTNKYYIGSAVDFDDRWRLHLLFFRRGNHHNRHMQRAWDKHGEAQFGFFILEITDDLEVREQYWIDKLDAVNRHRGYNICKAGRNRHGVKASEETRKLLSDSHKGHTHSAETKAKMSAAHKGNSVNKGRVWSKEAIASRVAGAIGKKRSAEGRANMSAAQRGRKLSSEAKLAMSLAAKKRHARERLQKSVEANDGSLDYTSDMWV